MSDTLTLKAAQEKRMQLGTEMRKLVDDTPDGGWTPEIDARFNEMNAEYDTVQGQMDALNKQKEAATRAASIADKINDKTGIPIQEARDITQRGIEQALERPITAEDDRLDLNREMRSFMVNGQTSDKMRDNVTDALKRCPIAEVGPGNSFHVRLSATKMSASMARDIIKHQRVSGEQRKELSEYFDGYETRNPDMGSEQAGFGLEWVAIETMNFVNATLIEVGNLRARASVIRTAGAGEMRIPLSDDTANLGEIVAENDATSAQDVPTSNLVLGKYQYSSKLINVHNTLLLDPTVNSEFYIGRAAGIRVARIQNQHFTVGTGTGQPRGVVTSATDSGVTTSAAGVISYDDVVDVYHSLDSNYSMVANWELNRQTIGVIRKIKGAATGNDHPIWSPGLAEGNPETILGAPAFINPDVPPASTASAKALIFGDMSQYYIRDMRDAFFTRSEHFRFDRNQTSFIFWMLSDGGLAQPTAVKFGTMGA